MSVAVAHSDSAEGQAALRLAAKEALLQQTEMIVVKVVLDGDPDPDEAQREVARTVIAERLAGHGCEVGWDLVFAPENPDRAATLVDVAIEREASLLVIGAKRRTPVGKFLLGSTVQRVVLDAPMPVFVVKAPPTR